jgi:Ca2+/H+ antiporter
MGASAQASLMLLAVMGLMLPTLYSSLLPDSEADEKITEISRYSSVLLLFVYAQ